MFRMNPIVDQLFDEIGAGGILALRRPSRVLRGFAASSSIESGRLFRSGIAGTQGPGLASRSAVFFTVGGSCPLECRTCHRRRSQRSWFRRGPRRLGRFLAQAVERIRGWGRRCRPRQCINRGNVFKKLRLAPRRLVDGIGKEDKFKMLSHPNQSVKSS